MENYKKDRLRNLGFDKAIDNVENGLCAFCAKPIKMEDFRDTLSHKEFTISGMCQKCIDETYE